MANKINESPALKGRQTKLMKKSYDELIQLVLKKDRIEKNMSAQIVNLKAEVNNLTKKISNFNKDMEGTEKELKNLKDTNKVSREQIDSLRIRLKDEEDEKDKNNKYIVELEEINHSVKSWAVTATLIAIAAILCWIIF